MNQPAGDVKNADQIAYWNGPAGQRWTNEQATQDTVFKPVSALLIDRAKPQQGERIIDVGCGCGAVAIELAARVGASGGVLGVDISAQMLARAKQMTPQGAPLEFVLADATTYPFAPGAADLLVSRFGVMFFAEPVRSFANMRMGLRKGGRLTFICWRTPKENPWMILPLQAVYAHVPKLPPVGPEDPGPFAFASASRVEQILFDAGFADVRIEQQDLMLDIAAGGGLEAAVQKAVEIGPANRALEGATPEVRAAAMASVRQALTPYAKGASVGLPASIWVVSATSP